ncbi:hypothetical protein GWI34_12640 [Actinomadura sp. DSM 109109]|nr:hypothetical protein [Actinomadura lepetitiana]
MGWLLVFVVASRVGGLTDGSFVLVAARLLKGIGPRCAHALASSAAMPAQWLGMTPTRTDHSPVEKARACSQRSSSRPRSVWRRDGSFPWRIRLRTSWAVPTDTAAALAISRKEASGLP